MLKLFKDKMFWKNALSLAIPVALQNMLISSFTLADTLLVSNLGDVALSSVGMVGQWGWLINMMIIGFCSGTTVFVSQYWGTKNKKKIWITCGVSFTAIFTITLIFTLASLLFPSQVISIFNKDPQIIKAGSEYLSVVAYSYIAVALSNLISYILRATEEVKLPMYVSAFTTVLNIYLDYCMIFGKCGFAEMGIKGAALATTISAWSGIALVLIVSMIRKNILYTNIKNFFSFSFEDIKLFFKKAFPVVCNESLWGFGTFVFNIIFANMGYEYFAALTIFRTFDNMAFVFFIGLCSATSVMVGKSVGKGKIERAVDDSKRFAIIVPIFAIFIGIVIILSRTGLVGIFNLGNNISQLTLETAKIIMTIYAFELPIRMIPYIQIVGIFRSGGDTIHGVKYDLSCIYGISIPVVLIAVYLLKVPFVVAFALMYMCEDYVKTFLCIRHYRTYTWIKPVTDEGKEALVHFKKKRNIK